MIRIQRPSLPLVLLLVLCVAGAWVSSQLVRQHDGVGQSREGVSGLLVRLCDASLGTRVSCNATIRGGAAEFTVPVPVPHIDFTLTLREVTIPVAFVGVAYFVSMGVWFTVLGRPRSDGSRWHWVPLGGGLCGVAASVLLIGVMAFQLASMCVLCLIAHAVNVLMVGAAWGLRNVPRVSTSGVRGLPTEECGRARGPRRAAESADLSLGRASVAIGCSLLMVAGLWFYRRSCILSHREWSRLQAYKAMVTSLRDNPEFLLREHVAQPRYDIPTRTTEPSMIGRPQLVVFTDFQCPGCHCKARWIMEQLVAMFQDRLVVCIRHFPLCDECNDGVNSELHRDACDAAYAVEAARLLGGEKAFWQMHDLLFENSGTLGMRPYRVLAMQIGLDADRFVHVMRSETVRDIVASDIALARRLGVTGTPTLFFNGRRVSELCETPKFWQAVAKAASELSDHTLVVAGE